jgi:hypothetical protein
LTKTSDTGPFLRRLWFSDEEFEDIAVSALRRQNLNPSAPSPVNIEWSVELELGISYKFGDLGPNLLGQLRFGETGPKKLIVHRRLDRPRRKMVTSSAAVRSATNADTVCCTLISFRNCGKFVAVWSHFPQIGCLRLTRVARA